jgi:hypothetical protein
MPDAKCHVVQIAAFLAGSDAHRTAVDTSANFMGKGRIYFTHIL